MTSMIISKETWKIINSHREIGESMQDCMLRLMNLKPQPKVKQDAPPVTN